MKYHIYECNACLEAENCSTNIPCRFSIPEFLGKPEDEKLACPISAEECVWEYVKEYQPEQEESPAKCIICDKILIQDEVKVYHCSCASHPKKDGKE